MQHLTSCCILWPNHTSAQILQLENRAAGASLPHTVDTPPEAVFLLVLYFTCNHPLQENLAKLKLFISKLSKVDFEAMNHLTIGGGRIKIKAQELWLSTERKPENIMV